MNRHLTLAVTTCLTTAALLAPCAARSDQPEVRPARQLTAVQRLTDLTPERVAAFRRTLAEMGATPLVPPPSLHFQVQYEAPSFRLSPAPAQRLFADDDTLVVPPGIAGRDAWFEEQYVIAGREDDFEDAAEKWVTRKVKGSDGAAAHRGHRMAPKFGWDGGPLAGFRRGPISVMGGEDQWSVRFTHKMKRPGWVARVGGGVEDGEERVAFTIGRSLFHATTGKR
jgi:hypothetical protein